MRIRQPGAPALSRITIAVPNFNRATRPVFGPGSDPNPPVDTGDGFLMRRGFVVLSCAWQGDLPDLPGLLRLHGPDALHADGRPIAGRVYTQLQSHVPAASLLLSDRGHRPYPAADIEEREAQLTVQDQPDGEPVLIPHSLGVVLFYYGVAGLVTGTVLSVVFQVAHCVEEAEFPVPRASTGRIDHAWAIHQVETSVGYAQDKSFRAGLASHFRWLRRMGMPNTT